MFVDKTIQILSQNLQEVIFKVGEVLKPRTRISIHKFSILSRILYQVIKCDVLSLVYAANHMIKSRRNSRNVSYDPCLV